MAEKNEIKLLKTEDLHLDNQNPRLPEYGLSGRSPEGDIIKILWDAMDVKELVMSIVASGFFEHEPLIVAQEDNKHIVIEGNRRLAAVKLLLDPGLAQSLGITGIPKIAKGLEADLQALPVLVQTREKAWKYLGFKHVNGPAKWGSYAKAKYIGDVHRNYKIPLKDIANQIGDNHQTVQKLFRGLMVIEQAERRKVFDREDRFRSHFSFSHITTGLQLEGFQSFLSIKSESDEAENPVPEEKINELKELCLWVYGSRKQEIQPVIESQNPDLRQLNAVLQNKEALAALRAKEPLRVAFELSRPVGSVFEESLLEAKRSLQRAKGLASEAYDGSEELLRISGTVADLADSLYNEMESKKEELERQQKKGESKKRITEKGTGV